MASVLPFDNATINSVDITTANFIAGSGQYTEEGNDTSTTTADGKIHRSRKTITRSAQFRVRGNVVATYETAKGLGVTCLLKLASTTLESFTAIVEPTYSSDTEETTVNLKIDPIVS